MGQGQVFKKNLHELFLAQGKDKVVVPLPRVTGLTAAAGIAALGALNPITPQVVHIARVHGVTHPTLTVLKHRFVDIALGD